MTAEHRAEIQRVVQGLAASAKAYDERGRSSMPIELDHVTSLMVASHDFAIFDARIERLLTLVNPIVEAGKGQIGTHSDRCFEYHHGCLAVLVQSLLTEPPATPDTEPVEREQ
jgi:hypothetical protein